MIGGVNTISNGVNVQTQTTPAVTDMGIQVTPSTSVSIQSSTSYVDSSAQATSNFTNMGIQANSTTGEMATQTVDAVSSRSLADLISMSQANLEMAVSTGANLTQTGAELDFLRTIIGSF